MTKMTKRQYLALVAANEAAIVVVQAELESYNERVEGGEKISEELSNDWNNAHDKEWELEQERMSIECAWSTRNWNWQDHSFASLVADNID